MESSINFLAALIWFLKQYKQGIYCTLPHVIELSKAPYDEVFTILNAEPSTRGLVVAFKEAFLNKTTEMLDGQIASARIPLARLDSPDFYYVLSGNDLTLEINDPVAPVVLCLGGDSTRQDALAPVLSLYIDRLNRLINRPDRRPTGVVIDEFATVRATSVLNIIATGRSNNIVPILAVQDLSQLKSKYSHDEAEQIMNTAGNLICGQVMGETAKWVSDRFAANMQLKTTISVNSSDESISKTEQSVDAVTPATLANLSSGEFVGLIADDPKQKIELKGFHASFTKTPSGSQKQQALPMVQEVTKKTIEDNFNVICEAVAVLIKDEMKRILSDPALRQYVVKR
jgi:type IV secretory pathway TraG/TraD family ATPase VirD4